MMKFRELVHIAGTFGVHVSSLASTESAEPPISNGCHNDVGLATA
jgi:hypothetical protein